MAWGFIKWFGYIYKVAKSVEFSFGQKKKQIKTKSFSSVRIHKSVGFPKRTTHSFGVIGHLRNEQMIELILSTLAEFGLNR